MKDGNGPAGRRPWRVNLHVPAWYRPPQIGTPKQVAMLETLQAALLARACVQLSGSAAAHKPALLGPRVWALNYHQHWRVPRNLNYKEAYLPGYFTFDPCGYSGWSCNAGLIFDPADYTADQARRYHENKLVRRYLARGVSKYRQVAPSGEPIPRGCIFVALQVPRDSVLSLASLDTAAMLEEVLRLAPAEPVVIKLHPRLASAAFAARIRALHDPVGNVHVRDEPIGDLIAAARVTVCINSGVGIEAQLRGGAVITCGRSDYGALTPRVTTRAELAAALRRAEPPDPHLMRRHAIWLFRDVFVDTSTADWPRKVIRRLRRA